MSTPRFNAIWSLILALALVTTIAGPTLTLGAQSDATPAASDSESSSVAPLVTSAVVPADAVLYAAVTVDSSSQQWAQSEALLRRAGLADVIDSATEDVATEVMGGETDIALLADGEVAFVIADFATVIQSGEPAATDAEQPDGLAFVLAPRDPDAADALARELTEADAQDRGGRVLEVIDGDATIYYAPGDEFDSGTAYVRLGDLLVVSTTPDDLAPFIAAAAGQTAVLADDTAFTQMRDELSNDFLAFGFLNGPAFREDAEPFIEEALESGAGSDPDIDIEQIFASLDVLAAFVLWADEPGFRFDTLTLAGDGGALPTVPANFDATLDERVPADTIMFVDGYDLGPMLAPQLDAAAAAIVQLAAEDPTFPFELPIDADDVEQAEAVWELVGRFLAFNPRTDLIDQLVGEWGLALSVDLDDPTLVSGVLVSGAESEPQLNDTVTKLAVWFNLIAVFIVVSSTSEGGTISADDAFGAHTEEVDGTITQVIEIPVPELGTTIRLQWGVVDGEFIFGFGDGFGEYTAGSGEALADNPRYQAIMAELPDEYFAVSYLDLGQVIDLVMPLIEDQLIAAAAADTEGTAEPIVLPDLSAIQALATVGFQRDDMVGSSTLLLIAE